MALQLYRLISQDFSKPHGPDNFPLTSPRYLELAVFRFEDVCVMVQDDMKGYLRTAALEKKVGVEATFRWLRRRNVNICLLTDFNRDDFLLLISRLGWSVGEQELIQLVVLRESEKENPVRMAYESAGLRSPRQAIVVVDSPRLLHCARTTGSSLVFGVTNGKRNYRELADQPFRTLLDGIIQLPNYLLSRLPEEQQAHPAGDGYGGSSPLLRLPE